MDTAVQPFNNAADAQKALNRALVFAVARGQANKVSELVKQGADIHWKGSRHRKSLLQVAVVHNRADVARVLIAAGADVNAQDIIKRTPLFEALRRDYLDLASALLDAGADPNLRCLSSKMSPAVWPLTRGYGDIIDKLLAHGLDLTAKDDEERTPLFHTVCFRSLIPMRKLLAAGASVKDVNGLLHTPLAVAADGELVRHMLLLIKAGAEVDTKDYQGDTPLNRAARYGHLKSVKVLLRKGAHTDVPNDKGMTPMQSAQKRLEDVKRFPNAGDYAKKLKLSEEVLSVLRQSTSRNLQDPFKNGTKRKFSVGKTLQLKIS